MNSEFMEGWLRGDSSAEDRIYSNKMYIYINDNHLHDGMIFNQLMYWSGYDKNGNRRLRAEQDGHMWIAKEYKDWWKECCVNENTAKKAINRMAKSGLIIKKVFKFNGQPTTHLRINFDKFEEKVRSFQKDTEYLSGKIRSTFLLTEYTTENTTDNDSPKGESSPSEAAEKIFSCWNRIASEIKGLNVHKSIYSKCRPTENTKKLASRINGGSDLSILEIINLVLQDFSVYEVDAAIMIYADIIESDDYWYSHRFGSLGNFLASKSGLPKFLQSANPYKKFKRGGYVDTSDPFSSYREKFQPISRHYEGILDEFHTTYYGFKISDFASLTDNIAEIEYRLRGDTSISKSDFVYLEECIAGLLYSRKGKEEENLQKLQKLFPEWEKRVDKRETMITIGEET